MSTPDEGGRIFEAHFGLIVCPEGVLQLVCMPSHWYPRREFDGSLVRHEKFIFLDVVWLATILKPLLNHKDEETFDGSVNLGDTGDARITLDDPLDIASWHKLKREGILEPRLAHAMWPAGLCNYVLQALASLDLTFPLENDPAGGLVVLLRLGVDRPVRAGKVMDTFCSTHTPAFSANWKIFLGAPAGAIEKLLTRCCSIGGVRTFWRYGVLVHGGLGDGDVGGLFAAVLEYSSGDNMLSAQVHGDISTPAPWAALSYVISAVRLMLLEFPGLRSRGSLQCPQHGDSMPLSNTVSPGTPFFRSSVNSRAVYVGVEYLYFSAWYLVRVVRTAVLLSDGYHTTFRSSNMSSALMFF